MANVDCSNNNLSIEQYLSSMLGKNANNRCGFRIIVVNDGDDDLQKCDFNTLDEIDIFKMCIGIDSNGNMGLRVILDTDNGENCIDCNNNYYSFKEHIVNNVVTMADDGYPALRLVAL